MKNLKNKFFSVLLISIMVLSSMNVIAAVSDDSAIEEETEDALMEVDNSDDNDLKKDAEKTDKVKSDDPKDDVSDDGPSADEENKLTVTNYSGTYNGTQTVYIKAENGDDTIYDNGTVTINPVKITLTADSASKTYDGSALKSNGYSITKGSFASGEGLEKVVVSGSQTEVGSSKNQITKYSLKSNTKAQNYDITLKAGTLTVNKSKDPVKNEEKNKPKKESKRNNDTNKTNKTNTTVIPQQNTGVPILVLAFSLFVIATLVKRD